MSNNSNLRFNLIRQYCFTVIDANIILHHLFNEEMFRPKIDYFIKNNHEQKIVCEVLPKTVSEVNKKIFEATNEFSNLQEKCKNDLVKISRTKLSDLKMNKDTGNFLEKTFSAIFTEIARKRCPPKQKSIRMQHARIVEATIMLTFWQKIGNTDEDMEVFFKEIKNEFGANFKKISSKQARLISEIGASYVDNEDVPETTDSLRLLFSKTCRINNTSDVELLCQAVSRMYKLNRWCVLLTTDYNDIVSKKDLIWTRSLLTICDPLYYLYKLDNKMDMNLLPKATASKYNILFGRFFKSKTPFGVI